MNSSARLLLLFRATSIKLIFEFIILLFLFVCFFFQTDTAVFKKNKNKIPEIFDNLSNQLANPLTELMMFVLFDSPLDEAKSLDPGGLKKRPVNWENPSPLLLNRK